MKQLNDQNFVIFGDNSPLHTAKSTKQELKRLGFDAIYNIPSEPDLNPIEIYFSVFKSVYRKLRLNQMMNYKQARIEKIVMIAAKSVK